MNVRADIAELLRAGLSDRAIGRQLGVDPICTVRPARQALGIPKAKPGRKPAATPEDLFWHRVRPTDDGHMEWTGSRHPSGTPLLRHGGVLHTGYRLAFRIANGRDPEGYALPSCGRQNCVKPGHHGDRDDRAREKRVNALYSGIFGPSA
ncbi:hypothetical protein [Streptomyces sp. NPDC058694]|uniref:hypothetical protein n=1 Tax=Streptomyces sp. NPDC058694 TaxID=3346603 RepID=UPI0036512893